jgi:CDP-glucose 4,6-dehydratase
VIGKIIKLSGKLGKLYRMELLKDTYQNKKVFLTGHTGFKGSWMLAWLHLLGCEVKGYAFAPEHEEDLYHVINGDALCQSIIADIRDKERLEQEILTFQPDFIFHLAAQPLVRRSYQNPLETYETNVMGTAYLLEAIKKLEKPCSVVLITTDKVYENKEWVYPYRENDPLGGYDPYSASKAAAEIVISSYRNSFFNTKDYSTHKKGIAVGRAGNVIGGGDWSEDRLIPDIIKSLKEKKKIIVRNPSAVRPWQHVLEPIRGYLQLGAKLAMEPIKFSQAYNFGPYMEDTLTVGDIVNKVIDIWGEGDAEIQQNTEAPHEAGLLKLDINKAVNELQWLPKLNANVAIEKTIAWYKVFIENGKNEVASFTIKQIAEMQ